MLRLQLPEKEYFDEEKERFFKVPAVTLELEHNLESLAKWESKWNLPFLSSTNMTKEQTIDYVRCMSIQDNVDPDVFERLTIKDISKVNEYIDLKMSATTINRREYAKPSREIVTAEIIYFWMIEAGIPFEPCEKWHLNRLLMLIQVCALKTGPQKKMGKKEQMAQQRALNNMRRARMHTKG